MVGFRNLLKGFRLQEWELVRSKLYHNQSMSLRKVSRMIDKDRVILVTEPAKEGVFEGLKSECCLSQCIALANLSLE